ncbi:hypothetical protein FQA39_LY13131 [Lamprigera yunnana]|nr:hypothetical protein FQA39_LY13131 [Lamprigera yunnana]
MTISVLSVVKQNALLIPVRVRPRGRNLLLCSDANGGAVINVVFTAELVDMTLIRMVTKSKVNVKSRRMLPLGHAAKERWEKLRRCFVMPEIGRRKTQTNLPAAQDYASEEYEVEENATYELEQGQESRQNFQESQRIDDEVVLAEPGTAEQSSMPLNFCGIKSKNGLPILRPNKC